MPTGTEARYNRAVEIIRAAGAVSIHALIRGMGVTYAEAGHLIERMEAEGVIGTFNGMKPREIRAVEK